MPDNFVLKMFETPYMCVCVCVCVCVRMRALIDRPKDSSQSTVVSVENYFS